MSHKVLKNGVWNDCTVCKMWKLRKCERRNTMIKIEELKKEVYTGKDFTVRYQTEGYYDIQATETGFDIRYKNFTTPKEMSFRDTFFNEGQITL